MTAGLSPNACTDKIPWRVHISSALGHAVALTPTRALVFRYAHHTSSDPPTTYTLHLPAPSTTEPSSLPPLPIGTLVHDAGAGDLALLAILPSQRILYWESVSSAARADPQRQLHLALQGTLPGVHARDALTRIVAAEPDAFVAATAAGKLVHVSVRDPQGRPALSAAPMDARAAGFWGALRQTLGPGAWATRRVAAVRVGRVQGKSRRRCVVGMAGGALQTWELARHGARTLEGEVEGRAAMVRAVAGDEDTEVEVRDLVLFPREKGEEEERSHRILILAAVKTKGKTTSYLFNATLYHQELRINVAQAVESIDGDSISGDSACHLLLPRAAHTAIVVLETRIAIVALSPRIEPDERQLLTETGTLRPPFEDSLYFSHSRAYQVAGCAIDEQDDSSSDDGHSLLFVDHLGMVRLSTTKRGDDQSAEDQRATLCRSKIEQAVFYGSVTPGLIDFGRGIDEIAWAEGELEKTLLLIDASILDNSSSYVSALTPSMEQQLKHRAHALAELIRVAGGRGIGAATRWKLLASGEKMAFARAIWKVHEAQLEARSMDWKPLLPELLDMISEAHKHENRPERGETDIVRHYLIHDVGQIQMVIPWCAVAARQLFEEEDVHHPVQQASVLSQANDLYTRGLDAAIQFRAAHAVAYGLGEDTIDDDGIFQGSCLGMPEPWTADDTTTRFADKLFDLTASWVDKDDEGVTSPAAADAANSVIKIASDTPALARLCFRTLAERTRWLQGHAPHKAGDVQQGKDLEAAARDVRHEVLLRLGESLDNPDAAIALAEQYRDMGPLADLIALAEQTLEDARANYLKVHPYERRFLRPKLDGDTREAWAHLGTDHPLKQTKTRLDAYAKKTAECFTTFGYPWAHAHYTSVLQRRRAALLFAQPDAPFLGAFLASDPRYARLHWIHAVRAAGDFRTARAALVACLADPAAAPAGAPDSLAQARALTGLAKLAALAEQAAGPPADPAAWRADVATYDARLVCADVQARLRAALHPLTHDAIDKQGEADIVAEALESAALRQHAGALRRFRAAIETLVHDRPLLEIDLVDVFTLLVPAGAGADALDGAFFGARFVWAFRVLALSPWPPAEAELVRRIVWVRCLLQDDWERLNRTEGQGDARVGAAMRQTVLYRTLAIGFDEGTRPPSPLPPRPLSALAQLMPAVPPGTFDDASPLSPAALLAAGPPSHDDLVRSEPLGGADKPKDLQRDLARDVAADWKALQRAVDKGRLDRWWDGVVAAALQDVHGAEEEEEEAADAAVDEGAETETDEAAANGHEQDGDTEMDDQGDVVMG